MENELKASIRKTRRAATIENLDNGLEETLNLLDLIEKHYRVYCEDENATIDDHMKVLFFIIYLCKICI